MSSNKLNNLLLPVILDKELRRSTGKNNLQSDQANLTKQKENQGEQAKVVRELTVTIITTESTKRVNFLLPQYIAKDRIYIEILFTVGGLSKPTNALRMLLI